MRSRRLLFPVAPAALLLAALVAPRAWADGPFVTDPAGDAGRCTGFCLTPTVASEPAIDILEADMQLQARTLTFTIKVLDLDRVSAVPPAPKGDDDVTYQFRLRRDDLLVNVSAQRTYAHGDPKATLGVYHYDGTDHNVFRPVPFTFDSAGDRLTVNVPLDTLNGAVAEACPGCAPVGRGTAFDVDEISAFIMGRLDTGTSLGSGWTGITNADTTDVFGRTYTLG